MRTKQQIIIDKYIARPVAYLMNFLVRILGKILSIDHNLDRDFKRIVVCKFKGLGSIIQCTPMLAALRNRYPNAEIVFVSTKANEQFLRRIGTIDRIVIINDKSFGKLVTSIAKSCWTLLRMRPDVYIDLEIYSDFSTLVTLFSCARNRIGFYLRSSSFRMGIYTHMMFFNTEVQIAEVYLQIARLFGPVTEPVSLYPLYEGIDKASLILPEKAYIVVNPNASDLRIERRWGADKFRALIADCIAHYPDKLVVLVGSPAERAYTEEVSNGLPDDRVWNLAGKTSIDQLIGLIRHAALVVTNDTGPMHIAFSCKSPTICLFGPCSPVQYGWVEHARIIYKRMYCSPCVHDFGTAPCRGNNVCMQQISVAEVMMVITDYFDRGIPLNKDAQPPEKAAYAVNEEVLGLVNRVAGS